MDIGVGRDGNSYVAVTGVVFSRYLCTSVAAWSVLPTLQVPYTTYSDASAASPASLTHTGRYREFPVRSRLFHHASISSIMSTSVSTGVSLLEYGSR